MYCFFSSTTKKNQKNVQMFLLLIKIAPVDCIVKSWLWLLALEEKSADPH